MMKQNKISIINIHFPTSVACFGKETMEKNSMDNGQGRRIAGGVIGWSIWLKINSPGLTPSFSHVEHSL